MYARVETETLEEMTDAELIRRFKRGDDQALAMLLTRHRDALYRFCCHLVPNRQDAEDICQESLTRAIDRVDTLKAGSAFRSWLFRIARNLSIDAFRQQRRVVPLPEEDVTPEELHTEGPHDIVEVGEERHIVSLALRRLTPNHQKVLMLREVEGLSYAEIAGRLGLSQSAVETLLFRARRRLREEYGKTAVSLPGFALVSSLPALASRLAAPLTGSTSLLGKVALTAAVIGGTAASVPHLFPRPQHFAALPSTHHLAVFQSVPARPATPVIATRSGNPRPFTSPRLSRVATRRETVAPIAVAVAPSVTVVGSRTTHAGYRVVARARTEGLIAVGQRLHVVVEGARHVRQVTHRGHTVSGRSGDHAVISPPAPLQIAAGPAGELGVARGRLPAPASNQGASLADPGTATTGSAFSSTGTGSEGSLPVGTVGPTGVSVPAATSVGLTQPAAPSASSLPGVAGQQPTSLSAQPSTESISPSSPTAYPTGTAGNTGQAGGPGASAPGPSAPVGQDVGSSAGQEPALGTTSRP